MANIVSGIPVAAGGVTPISKPVSKEITPISLKLSGLVNLFNPGGERASIPFSGQLVNQSGKAGFVVYSHFQIRPESNVEDSKGATKYLVELFESSELGPEAEEEEIPLEEEVDLPESEEIEDEEEETDGLDMEEGAFDEKEPSLFPEEEGLCSFNDKQVVLDCKILQNIGFQQFVKESCFFQETEEGFFLGFFGGSRHSVPFTKKVAEQCLDFQGKNPEAFRLFMSAIEEEIGKNQLWSLQGSSALLSFIEKKTGRIHTSGWGDSKLYLGRRVGDSLKLIPVLAETVDLLRRGDTLCLLSGGCDRCFSKEELVVRVEKSQTKDELALSFLNDALYVKGGRDNISVLIAKVL